MTQAGIEPSFPGLLANTLLYRFIGLVGRVFANGPGNLGSILGRVIPKTLKNTSWLNTQ